MIKYLTAFFSLWKILLNILPKDWKSHLICKTRNFNNIEIFSSSFRTNQSNRSFINATIKFNKYVFYRGEKQNNDKSKNISPEEVIEKITNECFNGDKQKGKKVYEEAINLIKSKIW